VIIDTSALLAVVFDEQHASWVADRLNEAHGHLRMSTVNLAETLILVRDRQPRTHRRVERRLLSGAIRFVAPTVEHARLAADARLRFPLNLGDCFAYALAIGEAEELLTLDADFRKTDAEVVTPR
jgi:ribonuclease VapC